MFHPFFAPAGMSYFKLFDSHLECVDKSRERIAKSRERIAESQERIAESQARIAASQSLGRKDASDPRLVRVVVARSTWA